MLRRGRRASADGAPARREVDLAAQEVRCRRARGRAFEIDPEITHRLLNGLDDIALTLQHEDEIAAYEPERERRGPAAPSTLSL